MIFSLIWWLASSIDYTALFFCVLLDLWFWLIFYNIPFKLWWDGPRKAKIPITLVDEDSVNVGQYKGGKSKHHLLYR
jgi:hypothetical protein